MDPAFQDPDDDGKYSKWIFILWEFNSMHILVAEIEGWIIFHHLANLSQVVNVIQILFISEDGPSLPTKSNEEFRPFMRRLPEFKFW